LDQRRSSLRLNAPALFHIQSRDKNPANPLTVPSWVT
jgi:hypothetical protein